MPSLPLALLGGLLLRVAAQLRVQTAYGEVEGFARNGSRIFRGVPYAAPPVGDLRFRPPQRHPGWNRTLEAKAFGPSCSVVIPNGCWNSERALVQSEDCLTVNVVTPDRPGIFPVMVYILSGEFHCGDAGDLESRFPYFATDVVFVSFQYRVGPFGFLAADELRQRHPGGGTGNYGLLDQVFLLQWVQENIAAFGGNASNVLIFGESSGGTCVSFHLTANGAKPATLFHKAILQSPGNTQVKDWGDALSNTDYTLAALAAHGVDDCQRSSGYIEFSQRVLSPSSSLPWLRETEGESYADAAAWCDANSTCKAFMRSGSATRYAGISGVVDQRQSRSEWTSYFQRGPVDPQRRLACLLGASALQLNSVTQMVAFGVDFFTDAWAPVLDGVTLWEPFTESIKHGRIAPNVDILLGSNLDEGTEFMGDTPPLECTASDDDVSAWFLEFHGERHGKDVLGLYESLEAPVPPCGTWAANGSLTTVDNATNYMRAVRSAGDRAIGCPTRRLAKNTQAAAYVYEFRLTPKFSLNFDETRTYGAFHGCEVPFVFGYAPEVTTDVERRVSKAMGCYWRSFAHHGDPSKEACGPEWPKFGTPMRHILQFDGNISVAPSAGAVDHRCDRLEALPVGFPDPQARARTFVLYA